MYYILQFSYLFSDLFCARHLEIQEHLMTVPKSTTCWFNTRPLLFIIRRMLLATLRFFLLKLSSQSQEPHPGTLPVSLITVAAEIDRSRLADLEAWPVWGVITGLLLEGLM